MSERESEQGAAEDGAAPTEPGSTPAVEPAAPTRRSGRAAPWLAALLILILAGVASSPFWAPQIEPLSVGRESRRLCCARRACGGRRSATRCTEQGYRRGSIGAQRFGAPCRPAQLSSSGNREAPAAPECRYRCDQFGSRRAGASRRSTRGRRQTRPRSASDRNPAGRAAARGDRNPIRIADGERYCRFQGYAAGALPPRQGRKRCRGTRGCARACGALAKQPRASDRWDGGAAAGTDADARGG